MERRIRTRIWILVILMFVIVGFFIARVYKLQTDETAATTTGGYTYATTVKAARGDILDRNGKVLVTNRASYNLTLSSYALFRQDDPNACLLELVRTLESLEVDYNDRLPISKTWPFESTLDDLGETWQNAYRDYLRAQGWDRDMSAATVMANLREKYDIPADWPEEDARLVAGLRYELSLRNTVSGLAAYDVATDLDPALIAQIVERDIPGVTVEASAVREYKTTYAAHVLGRTGPIYAEEYEQYREQGYALDAIIGKEGAEQAFESYLHGTDGTRITTVDEDGQILSEYYSTEPQAGNNVYLTIDIDLQQAAEEALEKVVLDLRENGIGADKEGQDAQGGAMVVLDVKTGDVLASANYPTYNLVTLSQDYNALLADEYSPLWDRCLQATYYPGSIFKMVTSIAAVDEAGISPGYPVEDRGKYTYYDDYQPNCYYYTATGRTHGRIDMLEALSESCNYYFYEVGRLTDITAIDKVSKGLGLGEATGVELPETPYSTRANPETKAALYGVNQSGWYGADTLQASIGQSDNKFTPMQLACYTGALANQGVRYRAHYLRRVVSSDYATVVEQVEPEILSTYPISDTAYSAVKNGMRRAAVTGTAATYLRDYPIAVCAKTGTAQNGAGITDSGSFVCWAPADDPQIAIVVYVERGAQGGNLGQAARAVMDVYFAQQDTPEDLLPEASPN